MANYIERKLQKVLNIQFNLINSEINFDEIGSHNGSVE